MKKLLYIATIAVAASFTACAGSSDKAAAEGADTVATEATEQAAPAEEASPVIELTAADSISLNPEKVTFVDFNAEWCGPCQQFKPVYEQVAKEYSDKVVFLSVNVDSCPDLAKQFRVTSIPQITIIRTDGHRTDQVGYMDLDQFTLLVKNTLGE